jgi:hypothetical protein
MPYRKGPKSAAQTPAPKADRVYGSKKNKANSADSEKSAKSIEFSDKIIATLKEKAKKYNDEHSTKVSLNTLKAVFRRGAGAFSVSHRPNMTRNGWAFARVNKFLEKKAGKKVKKAYIQDDDLLARGGKINDAGIESFSNGGQFDKEKGLKKLAKDKKAAITKEFDQLKKGMKAEQNKIVRTPEFKQWFGDWQKDPNNSSVVREGNGEPMVVWHGSPSKFNIFKNVENGVFYFAENAGYANHFADGSKNTYPYFLNIRKIFDASKFDIKENEADYFIKEFGISTKWLKSQDKLKKRIKFWELLRHDEDFRKYLINKGYDGVKYVEDNDDSWVEKSVAFGCFNANQIKLANGINTSFSTKSKDIRYKKGGATFNDKELLAKWEKGESIGFTGEAHLKAKGLIPRADGIKRKSDKYMENGGEVELLKVGQVLNLRRLPMYYRSGDLGKQREVSKKVVEVISKKSWTDEDDDNEYRRNKSRYYFKADDKKGYFATFWGKDLVSVNSDKARYEALDNPKMEDGGEVGQEIVCVNCGWGWNTDDSDENDKYICHKCGFDNNLYYNINIMGSYEFDEFADKRLEGAEKITNDSKNKGGLSMLTYYHYNVKLPFYEQASEGGFDLQEAKEQFKKYYNQLSYNMEQVEFQELMGKMEVLGELIIEQQSETPDKLKKPMTLKEISEKHGVDLDELESELEKGIEEEKEHTDDEDVARTIALHHLDEKPDYYDVLEIVMSKEDEDEFDGFKDGGVVVGKRHSESDENGTGEKFLVESTGQVVELEGGEAVLTKESMESGDKFSFEGKKMTGKEVASFLNHKYGGVEFKDGGSVNSGYGCNTKYYHGGELPTATVDSLKGGEAVITVRTMESRDKYNFNNRSLTPRQILSIINERSGGKKFERGGMLNTNMVDLTKMVYFTEKVLY